MTKRRVKNELDQLSDDVLSDLPPAERLKAFARVAADDTSPEAARLDETAPREDRSVRDPDYIIRRLALDRFAQTAVYNLHRLLLQYRWAQVSQAVVAPHVESDSEAAADFQPGLLFWALVDRRHLYSEFAAEELDLSLEEFLARHDNGRAVLAQVDQTIGDARRLHEDAILEYATRKAEADASAEQSATAPDSTPDDTPT